MEQKRMHLGVVALPFAYSNRRSPISHLFLTHSAPHLYSCAVLP